MKDPDAATAKLQQPAAELGVRLAVDDFGTGYSSLAYLQQFPIDMLKIDRSFVNDMPHRGRARCSPRIIQIAHTLGLMPIAEGVENQAQADALAELGCDLAQGFHLGRPADAASTRSLIVQTASPGSPTPRDGRPSVPAYR